MVTKSLFVTFFISDILENMEPLDASVNRSLGKQINNQIKDLPDGTKVGPFSIEER
jgi:hypothetical protein